MKSSNRDDGWLTGRLYFNREDKRVIIKRPRSGFGYTMNLGNKWTSIKENAEKAEYYALKTLRKVQKKVGFPERVR